MKCGNGYTIKIGENELDPCLYVEKERYKNVTVSICECTKCGEIQISWTKQDDTMAVEGDNGMR